MSVLGTGVILVVSFHEDIKEDQSNKWRTSCRSGVRGHFVHPSRAAIVIMKWQKVRFGEKEINRVLHCSNNNGGITIDHDININMLLEKMIQVVR